MYEPTVNRTIERKIDYLAISEKSSKGLHSLGDIEGKSSNMN